MNKPAARISALSLSMLLFVGCATTSVAPTSSPAQQAAIALLEQGKPRDAAQQLEHMRHYLASWHTALVREDWFNGHLRAQGLGGYYGLWAFEAAAAAKHLGLERSALTHWVMPPAP